MHRLLTAADGQAAGSGSGRDHALCFVVIIPSWEQTLGWRALKESPFCAHHLRLAQRQHGYTEGAQHCRRSRYRISVGDTSVFFLQSKAARSKWPVTASSLSKLEAAFVSKHRPSADSERPPSDSREDPTALDVRGKENDAAHASLAREDSGSGHGRKKKRQRQQEGKEDGQPGPSGRKRSRKKAKKAKKAKKGVRVQESDG